MKALAAIAALTGLVMSGPVSAQGCLDRETLVAARINEFGTMMMAVNLRCKAIGMDISTGYEAMLDTHRSVFAAADRKLHAFFAPEKRAFEAYATRLGNRYGAGATDSANCERFQSVARDLAGRPDSVALGRVVFAMVAQPRIEGATCGKP